MIYIMSDIHGRYDRYMKTLEEIALAPEDRLYVLGDVIDRGSDGIKVIRDLMKRDNAELFLGNHEHMMLTFLDGDDTISWFYAQNGGNMTFADFMALDKEERQAIEDYLRQQTTLVRHLQLGDKHYVLSHTGLCLDKGDLFTGDYEGRLMEVQDLVWNSGEYSLDQLEDLPAGEEEVILISGHIITIRLSGKDKINVESYDNGYTWIDIDCGCAIGGDWGQLACLQIDDEGLISEIIYVK